MIETNQVRYALTEDPDKFLADLKALDDNAAYQDLLRHMREEQATALFKITSADDEGTLKAAQARWRLLNELAGAAPYGGGDLRTWLERQKAKATEKQAKRNQEVMQGGIR